MLFSSVLNDAYTASERMTDNADDLIQLHLYCAKCEAYCVYLQNNREEAKLYYEQFRKYNDKIFKTAIDILDLAIDTANEELAKSALQTIQTMKSTYPDFYKSYYIKLFGRKRGLKI